jgi:hypothetical protein
MEIADVPQPAPMIRAESHASSAPQAKHRLILLRAFRGYRHRKHVAEIRKEQNDIPKIIIKEEPMPAP